MLNFTADEPSNVTISFNNIETKEEISTLLDKIINEVQCKISLLNSLKKKRKVKALKNLELKDKIQEQKSINLIKSNKLHELKRINRLALEQIQKKQKNMEEIVIDTDRNGKLIEGKVSKLTMAYYTIREEIDKLSEYKIQLNSSRNKFQDEIYFRTCREQKTDDYNSLICDKSKKNCRKENNMTLSQQIELKKKKLFHLLNL